MPPPPASPTSPPAVVAQAKRVVADLVGCAFGGAFTATGRFITDLATEISGPGEAALLGTKEKISAIVAAGANAKLANVLDFDDTLYGHPGACVVHPALALGQKLGSSGADLLRAVVLGYEVSCRIGAAIQPTPERFKQVWGLAPWNAFGAAVSCGALLNLGPKDMACALGIAGANAPVSSTNKTVLNPARVTMVKESFLSAGTTGAVAALLASRGYVGPLDILDGATGFWVMFGSDRCDFPRMVRGLGSEYEILKTSFKPYSTCRWIHPVIDALLQVLAEESLDPSAITAIEVTTAEALTVPPYTNPAPTNMEDAQFSVPFSMALAVYGGRPGPDWFKPERFTDPGILRLSRLVRLRVNTRDTAFRDAFAAAVTVAAGGREYTRRVDFALGSPERPMTPQQHSAKFVSMAALLLGPEKAAELYAFLQELEQNSLSAFTGLAQAL